MREFHHTGHDPQDLEALASLLEILAELDDEPETQEEPIAESELAEAQAQALAILAHPGPEHSVEKPDPIAALTIAQVEAWLDQVALEAVRARGAVSMPTVDVAAAELAKLGYAPDVEIDADIDSDARTATITVLLRPIRDNPGPLKVVVTSGDGSSKSARVDEYGLATVADVPVTKTTPDDLTFKFFDATSKGGQ